MNIGLEDYALAFGLLVLGSIGMDSFAATVLINSVNTDTAADRINAVNVSLSQKRMTWRGRSWAVVGSLHTPIGRFRLAPSQSGSSFGIRGPIIPFKFTSASDMSTSHPYFQRVRDDHLSGTTFGIHINNLSPGKVGAGCLMVSGHDMDDITRLLPGATINIRN